MKISATIITLNEQKNIARAIKSLDFVDEIIVIDSGSSDDTCKIARELGAQVTDNKFSGFGQQKNFASQQATHSWILSIDADEEIDQTLQESILKTIKSPNANVYSINRRTKYRKRWIYHGGWYPDHLIRLYKKECAKWSEPFVHEELITDEEPILLKGHLNHYSFPDYLSQIEVNIKYAKLGAKALIKKKGKSPSLMQTLIRPIIKFIECYFLKLGFLDGKEGLIIALNAGYSMFMKYIFARDLDENN